MEKSAKLQLEAENFLRQAFTNERAGRWSKVVEAYENLLEIVEGKSNPYASFDLKLRNMFLYESNYHLGLALQNLNRHKEAIFAYNKAINVMSVPKNGCLAGCNSTSSFQTPVLAKRAFANAKIGNMRNAFIDIDKAIQLDPKNSDLYCIRALLHNTNKDTNQAIEDINRALKYNPCHVCALILRGTVQQPFKIRFSFLEGFRQNDNKDLNKDHIKAKQISAQAALFFDVANIHHPKLLAFWNRFLWSLIIPRILVRIDMLREYSESQQPDHCHGAHGTPSRVSTPGLQNKEKLDVVRYADSPDYLSTITTSSSRRSVTPFRCGMITPKFNMVSTLRRNSYGEAVRNSYVTGENSDRCASPKRLRPKTAIESRGSRPKRPISSSQSSMREWLLTNKTKTSNHQLRT